MMSPPLTRALRVLTRSVGQSTLARHFRANGLYCFNLHRIGPSIEEEFHPNIFSCDPDQLAITLRRLKVDYTLVDLAQAIRFSTDPAPMRERFALVTFDDGYVDQVREGLPVLVREGVRAVFFLTAGFVGTETVPWWDEAAWLISNAGFREVILGAGRRRASVLNLRDTPRRRAIRLVLSAMKSGTAQEIEEDLDDMRNRAGVSRPDIQRAVGRLLMNWDEVKSLRTAGMAIGSHGMTHRILGPMSEVDQRRELQDSKCLLEARIGEPVHSLAYPVGGEHAFTELTERVATSVGYRIAFSFLPGMNRHPSSQRMSLRRISIEAGNPMWS